MATAEDAVRFAEAVELQSVAVLQIPLQPSFRPEDAQPQTTTIARGEPCGHQRSRHIAVSRPSEERILQRFGRTANMELGPKLRQGQATDEA